ncbi:phosphate acyltransferase PlsX [Opitutaceae bacterium EW11]|nr:phosphate acyltransferase PlsX [Opitutaceae bacterium EW11]
MASSNGASGRIAVDAMGSDLGPSEVVEAVKLALSEFPGLYPVTLVGDEPTLKSLVAKAGLASDPRIGYLHASEVVTMDDKPLTAIKRKKDASMFRAIELVKSGEAGAAVSCGNTGSLVAAGILKLRTLDGIDRAALAPIIPRANGHFILIDAGANPEAKSDHLVHNAILGSHFCRMELEIERPRVGLLTIGTEEGKGNSLVAEAHESLKRIENLINYIGPVEGFQLFADEVDVVVCDGFVGNICLKSWESLSRFFSNELKAQIKSTPLRVAGGLLAKGAFDALKNRIKPERYGGAPLLGLRGNILKAHGSANRQALKNAIHDASEMIKTDLNQRIEADIARANDAIRQVVA